MNSKACRRSFGLIPANPHSAARRGAGLHVTSARLATLRMAPSVLEAHGRLSPKLLHAASRQHGHVFSQTAFYHALPALAAAGLLPTHALSPCARHDAVPSIASLDNPEQ